MYVQQHVQERYQQDTNNQHVCVQQHVQETDTDFTHPSDFWPRPPHFTHLSQIQSSGGVTTVDRCEREQRENRERTEREQRGNREIEGVQGILEKCQALRDLKYL